MPSLHSIVGQNATKRKKGALVYILFSPSEAKLSYGKYSPLSLKSMIFKTLWERRKKLLVEYQEIINRGDNLELSILFGLNRGVDIDKYRTDIFSEPTLPAIERYSGVAYKHLDINSLSRSELEWLKNHTIIFSNLFGPIKGGDLIPNYKTKQRESIAETRPDKWYKEHFTQAVEELLKYQFVLDLRSGYYDKFYAPSFSVVKTKFLKDGKVVSHYAKAYRGLMLRHIAKEPIDSLAELENLSIDKLELVESKKSRRDTLLIYNIKST